MRKAVVHRPHHAHHNRAVANPGVEDADRRRTRMDMGEFFGDAVGDLPFLAASIDEEQVFLAVVEETEIPLRIGRLARYSGPE